MEINKDSVLALLDSKVSFSKGIGDLIPAERVLVLAPHPDDEVLGCGGTLLRYIQDYSEVIVIYITDGRYGVVGQYTGIREKEAEEAWKQYKIKQIFLGFRDSNITEELTPRLKLILDSLKPDIIFTPWFLDMHADHKLTSYYLAQALTEISDYNPIISSYEVMYPLHANKTVNITQVFDNKLEVLSCYKSQTSYLSLRELAVNMSNLRAQLIRLRFMKAAEAFNVTDSQTYVRLIKCMFDNVVEVT